MLYRRFGKTELQMPVISFGCMRSMHSWTDCGLDEIPGESTAALETLARRALDLGINHFETARGYGSSERQLGQVLPKLNRDAFFLQTKIAPHHDTDIFIRNVHDSLERLQVDHVDLLALHGINDYESLWQSCRKGGCLAAARQLQREGKIGHVGFSGHGPLDVILAAIDHEEDGGFDFVNLHWYYIYTVNQPAIERAVERDLGVYIISPTDKGGMLHTPPASLRQLCAPLSPILFNDLFCLSQPGVASISVGAGRVSDFDEHLKALNMLECGRPKVVSSVMKTLEERMRERTGHLRPEGNWDELPEWTKSPGNINLRFIQWLDNLYRGWDLHEYAKTRYNMLTGGCGWVQGNSAAELDHVDFTKIMQSHPAVTDDLLKRLRRAHTNLARSSAHFHS